MLADLDKALAATARAFAVPSAHRADLPLAVRDLSRLLTEERGDLAQSYWAAPRFVGAYLRYFLPWNLLRLSWLLPGLDLPLAAGNRILDLGSGPLTLPLALWLSRPDLRSVELEYICSDVSPKILDWGRDIFQALAGPSSPWRIERMRATADAALRSQAGKKVHLVLAGNMLNERMRQRESHGDKNRRMDTFMALVAACLAPQGRALFIEPGTRLGGTLISQCREAALEQAFSILAPCTHHKACPLFSPSLSGAGGPPAQDARGHRREHTGGRSAKQAATGFSPTKAATPFVQESSRSWCHFTVPATRVPQALANISAEAGLEKDRLALSFLLLRREENSAQSMPGPSAVIADELDELEALYQEMMAENEDAPASHARRGQTPEQARKAPQNGSLPVRVVSGPIALPGKEAARYVCGAMGLGLLLDAHSLPSGTELAARTGPRQERDGKSGALILHWQHAPSTAGQKKNTAYAPTPLARPMRNALTPDAPKPGKPAVATKRGQKNRQGKG